MMASLGLREGIKVTGAEAERETEEMIGQAIGATGRRAAPAKTTTAKNRGSGKQTMRGQGVWFSTGEKKSPETRAFQTAEG